MGKLSKIQQILSLNQQGHDKVAIAELLKYKQTKSLISYMSRHGYTYIEGKFMMLPPLEGSPAEPITPLDPLDDTLYEPTPSTSTPSDSASEPSWTDDDMSTTKIPVHTSSFLKDLPEQFVLTDTKATHSSTHEDYSGDLSAFAQLDDYVSYDLVGLYNDLIHVLSPNQIYTLALLLLKDFIPPAATPSHSSMTASNEVSEQITRIQSIKSFICHTFGTDKEGLSYFFDTHNIAYTYVLLHEAQTIQAFLQKDDVLNEYLLQLNTIDLETLRVNISLAMPSSADDLNHLPE